jgi:2-polyprenyl-6-methoxyphenol hydroxylase-like FAD-dependent oxidoreductase
MMACALRRQGVSCRVVDQAEGPTPLGESRALAVWERTLEVFADLGVIDRFLAVSRKVHGLNAYSGGRRLTHVGFDLEGIETPYPLVLTLPQGQTERILLERLHDLGSDVQRRTKLVDLAQDGTGVTATLDGPDGARETVRSAWLIGCDGAHSVLRHQLGLAFEGSAYEEPFHLLDARIEWGLPDDEVHFFLRPDGGGLGCFPLPAPGQWRLVDAPGAGPVIQGSDLVPHFRSLLGSVGPQGARITETGWSSSFHIQRRIVDRFRAGRCFVAGDAAHVHSPAGGQGMNTGIQDAHNLAWKLALVVRGAAPATLLDSYEAERRPVALDVLRGTDLLTRAVTLRYPVAVSARNALVSFVAQFDFVRRRAARALSEVNIEYRHSPIVAEDRGSLVRALLPGGEGPGLRGYYDFATGPRAGDRVPDVGFAQGAAGQPGRLFETLDGTRHTLLLFEGTSPSADETRAVQAVAALVQQRDNDLVRLWLVSNAGSSSSLACPRLIDGDGSAHRRYGARSACLYLIRPDRYVGYRSQPPDADKLATYLRGLFV